jgi:hypothetical protein
VENAFLIASAQLALKKSVTPSVEQRVRQLVQIQIHSSALPFVCQDVYAIMDWSEMKMDSVSRPANALKRNVERTNTTLTVDLDAVILLALCKVTLLSCALQSATLVASVTKDTSEMLITFALFLWNAPTTVARRMKFGMNVDRLTPAKLHAKILT